MGRAGRKRSLRALEAAYDSGITFFDTARSYGYGESESVVGEFLQQRRDRVVLSTKFGIVAAPQPAWKQVLKPVVRAILDAAPATRRLVRGYVKAQFKENHPTPALLHKSLDESLRKLGTDYVDILFIHSAPASVLAQCDLLESLGELITCGKIRVAGISGDPGVIRTALSRKADPLKAMQFPTNIFDLTLMGEIGLARNRGLIFVANQPFGGLDGVIKSGEWLQEVSRSPTTPTELSRKLTSNSGDLLPDVVLNLVLQETGIQVAVTSMINVDHLRANVKAVSNCHFTSEELSWLRNNLAEAAGHSHPQVAVSGKSTIAKERPFAV